MPFSHVTDECLTVPGRTAPDELAFLALLAKQVPKGGQIVEIGPFYGRSTCAMAGANPDAQITSIDTFEDVDWTSRFAARTPGAPKFGRAAFDHFTKHLSNINVIEGTSPDVITDWAKPTDMFFEDAVHGNPVLRTNLDFWMARLRPGGIACGHDYTLRFPDVKAEVDRWAERFGKDVAVVGSLWALRRPEPECDAVKTDGFFGSLSDAPALTIRGANKKKGAWAQQGGYWAGAHLAVDRLNWFSIDDLSEHGIFLEYRLGHPDFGETSWFPAGQKARLDNAGAPRPFTRIAIRQRPDKTRNLLHVNYKISARQIGNGGFGLSGTSQWACDGTWAALAQQGPAVNALTVMLNDVPGDGTQQSLIARGLGFAKRAQFAARNRLNAPFKKSSKMFTGY